MTTKPKLMTAEELLLMPNGDMQRKLIRGVLTEDMPPGDEHGVLAARIGWLFANYCEENDYGEVRAGDSGFLLERGPDTVRGPDLAWVSPDRCPSRSSDTRSWRPTWWWRSSRPATPTEK